MNKKSNSYIQTQVGGLVMKTCWSMLWQKKQLSVMEVVKKGYKENSVRIAFSRFVKEGWAVKPEGTRNIIQISDDIEK